MGPQTPERRAGLASQERRVHVGRRTKGLKSTRGRRLPRLTRMGRIPERDAVVSLKVILFCWVVLPCLPMLQLRLVTAQGGSEKRPAFSTPRLITAN